MTTTDGDKSAFVLDGGFSSQLSCHVSSIVDGDPLWSARYLQTNPQEVLNTHLDFLRAGSDMIMTNTYQASVPGFVKHLGLSSQDSYELIKSAVVLAKNARDTYVKESKGKGVSNQNPLVVGSVGPYGAYLNDYSEYSGDYAEKTPEQTMKEWHTPRIKALIESDVDMLAFETVPCQKEAEMLVEMLKEYPDMKAWLTFSCKDAKSLAHGENFQMVAKKCWDMNPGQLVAIGVNCCSPKIVTELFSGINDDRKESPIPLITYPNSGEKYNPEIGWTDRDKCQAIETLVRGWLDIGVQYIGGCCRTYATDISQIRNQVDIWLEQKKLNHT